MNELQCTKMAELFFPYTPAGQYIVNHCSYFKGEISVEVSSPDCRVHVY